MLFKLHSTCGGEVNDFDGTKGHVEGLSIWVDPVDLLFFDVTLTESVVVTLLCCY